MRKEDLYLIIVHLNNHFMSLTTITTNINKIKNLLFFTNIKCKYCQFNWNKMKFLKMLENAFNRQLKFYKTKLINKKLKK